MKSQARGQYKLNQFKFKNDLTMWLNEFKSIIILIRFVFLHVISDW